MATEDSDGALGSAFGLERELCDSRDPDVTLGARDELAETLNAASVLILPAEKPSQSA